VKTQYAATARAAARPDATAVAIATGVILGRGPFTMTEERIIIAPHGIGVFVTKASGGAAAAVGHDGPGVCRRCVVVV